MKVIDAAALDYKTLNEVLRQPEHDYVIEGCCETAANCVLDDTDGDCESEEQKYLKSALFQQTEAGCESDAAEEDRHEDTL